MAKTKPQLQALERTATNQRLQNIERETGSAGRTIPTRWPLVADDAEGCLRQRRGGRDEVGSA